MNNKVIMITYGTRPEFLKVYPIIKQFEKLNQKVIVVNTGQHEDLLNQIQDTFNYEPDVRLESYKNKLDSPSTNLLAFIIQKLSQLIIENSVTDLISQGDTYTVLASSLISFTEKIRFHHIEAGLRTEDILNPFPEEYNRRVVSLGTYHHYCPTELSRMNLISEGHKLTDISIVGNTIVDTLEYVKGDRVPTYENEILITIHRRDNVKNIENIFSSIIRLCYSNPELKFKWVRHHNEMINSKLIPLIKMGVPSNLEIIDPLNYEEMIDYLLRVKLIISDSGGIQEEAPSFGKKILVVRESTERPEVIKCGAGILVKNTSDNSLFDLFTLINKSDYKYKGENPFGDGKSSELIVNKILSL